MRTITQAIEELSNRQARVEKQMGLNRSRFVSF
jgi:hypothetical protein